MRFGIFVCNSDNQSKKNPLNKNIKFHRFPENFDLCKQWLNAIKRIDNINVKTTSVSSKHFLDSDYKFNLKGLKESIIIDIWIYPYYNTFFNIKFNKNALCPDISLFSLIILLLFVYSHGNYSLSDVMRGTNQNSSTGASSPDC
ncbi:unnamed protein product [Brassicogethes aeneus]|uniref:THAP-type domain-containing protein n=1 Tax=Brassicogethes aeneus TaxID=1431903 RepID=A0A9P0FCH3_BRAAE|nr:unnamed protein product [Brassicogethes aeneus]